MKFLRGTIFALTVHALALVSDAVNIHGKAATALETRQRTLEAAWSSELDEPDSKVRKYSSPVQRVVRLLQNMREELEAEGKKEEEMYSKMVCWCENNHKEKTQALADAEAKDSDLSAKIEGHSARFGQLATNIGQMKEDLAANTQGLKQASSIREKEAAQFSDDEKDMVQAVTNLRNAIAVLAKHQGGKSMLQVESPISTGLRVVLRDLATKYDFMVASRGDTKKNILGAAALLQNARATSSDGEVQSSLINALDLRGAPVSDVLPLVFAEQTVAKAAGRTNTFLQKDARQPIFKSYASQSTGIYGILEQMLEDFGSQLTEAQKEEVGAKARFAELYAAKSAEIEVGKKKLDEMESDHANNQKALSDAKADLALTRKTRSENVEFMRNLKLTCNDLDNQWKKRSATRAAEATAVSEAIAVLTEDDNRELLAKSVSFLQKSAESSTNRLKRNYAEVVLRKAASAPIFDADDLLSAWHTRGKFGIMGAAAGPRRQLSILAASVKLDEFKKIKEIMDKMVVDLKNRQAEEVKLKDQCGNDFKTTEKTLFDKGEQKKDLETQIGQMETTIAKLQNELEEAAKQIAGAQVEIKKAGEQRAEENKQFQIVVADQRATQNILERAVTKLKDYYQKGINKAVFVQKAKGKQTPPEQFNAYKDHAGSKSVISLLDQIIGDSKSLETEAQADENSAQAAYESFIRDSNGLIVSLQEATVEKKKAVSGLNEDHALSRSDLENTNEELDSLRAYEVDLHGKCDFLMKNFDIRQQARLEEINAIGSAKAILSGSSESVPVD